MTLYLVIIFSLIFSAFFSGMEIAFISANRLKLEVANKKGLLSGKILAKFIAAPSHFISTSLFGNNVTLVIFGITMAKVLEQPLMTLLPNMMQSPYNVLIAQTIITTLIVLLFGEFLPKMLFRLSSTNLLTLFAVPFRIVYYLFYPFVISFLWISKQILNVFFRLHLKPSATEFTAVDLEQFIKEADKKIFEEETNVDPKLLENALVLKNIKIRECMVPRTEIIGIEIDEPITVLQKKFTETKLSRIVIYDETIDNIIGYAHHLAFLEEPKNIRSIVISLPLVPESMPADELLNEFMKEQKTLALVVDEFGGTAGIVTLEDIIEEIFGEIQDEFDEEGLIERKLNEHEYIFSARLEIDYLNEKYPFNLPNGDYETLAGMIISHYENIPEKNTQIQIDKFEFTILESTVNKIERLRVRLISDQEDQFSPIEPRGNQ